jgi:23S rRNA (adenine2503-C2)-methyltransferase
MNQPFDVIRKSGRKEVAFVYLLKSKFEKDVFVECVESLDPPKVFSEKWVITISSQKGCPVGCSFCDAGYYFKGNLSKEELSGQLDVILENHKEDGYLSSKKIKLHLARMGEPSFNKNIIGFLQELKTNYTDVNFIPSIATVGPKNRGVWFEKLKEIKDRYYCKGKFQLQFSLNTTDENFRDKIIPINKMSFKEISRFGRYWLSKGDRKITLNFALSKDAPFSSKDILDNFSPKNFLLKITPLNPRIGVLQNNSLLDYSGVIPSSLEKEVEKLEKENFEIIVSIGSKEEIEIKSNCGQMAFRELSLIGSEGVI